MRGERPTSSTHSINVALADDGWCWELIDADGATIANGVAAEQEDALKSAWSAARTLSMSAPGERLKTGPAARSDAIGEGAA